MKKSYPYNLLLIGSALWCFLLFIPPLLTSNLFPSHSLSRVFYSGFSKICHQDDIRSFHFLGQKLAVCIRCSSIYVGFFAGVVVFGLVRKAEVLKFHPWFIVSMLPMLIDVAFDLFGIHSSNDVTRCLTGSVFGLLAGIVLVPSFEEALSQFLSPQQFIEGVGHESQTG